MARIKTSQNATHTWDDGALIVHLDDLGLTKSEHYRFEPTTNVKDGLLQKFLAKIGLTTRGHLKFTGGVQLHATGLYRTDEIPLPVKHHLKSLGFETDADTAPTPEVTLIKASEDLRKEDWWPFL